MATFILIPGAGGAAVYWSLVQPLLERAGQRAIAVDLPGDDENAGLDVYAERVMRAMAERDDVILVAQSLGGFTAGAVCGRAANRIRGVVFVNAMIPKPGETAGAWWGNTGSEQARVEAAKRHGYGLELDVFTYFLHDVPQDVVRAGEKDQRPEAKIVFTQPCTFERWPDVPVHVLVGSEDRFFPSAFQERVARERLGKEVELITGGHLVALSNPNALADKLLSYTTK